MNKSGQIILVLISVAFNTYQYLLEEERFFSIDFFLFTVIAWVVGHQYDRARYFAEKAHASEQSYIRLIDSLPEAIFIHRNNKLIYANRATVTMIGAASNEEIIGTSIFDYIVPEYKERMLARLKQIPKETRPLTTIEYKLKKLDGSTIFFEGSSLSIVFGDKEAILTMGKDITERKEQTDRLLLKSEKLALLGQMAAGIAHEIRNPLTSIRGFIQLFKADNKQSEYYDIVLSELDRINDIVGEFLVLAKPTVAVFTEKDIRVLFNDVVTFFNAQSILSNVEIFIESEEELPAISCEENQLKQVFLNLLKNAVEAMPNGGHIYIKIMEKIEGEISVQIIDQGIGIPKERISTLGEPFYTTKEKGTGLGLMTCYKIIESHHGVLTIDSLVNKGTTIEILLPTITQPLFMKERSPA